MYCDSAKFDEINVLASQAGWAWPWALRDIFKPSGVNLMVASQADEFVNIIGQRRIHTAIVNMDSEKSNGLATVRLIRRTCPEIPCLLLTSDSGRDLLGRALELDVFCVIDKPVDMTVLHAQLDRLFVKKYNSNVFSQSNKLNKD